MPTPPPGDSPDSPTTPLPPPPRHQPCEVLSSPEDSGDPPAVPIEDQKGLSWLVKYPHDPLLFVRFLKNIKCFKERAYHIMSRALCLHYGVLKAPLGVGRPLPKSLDMEVVHEARIPTHVLALSKQATTEGQSTLPLMVPIQAAEWEEKMTMRLSYTTSGTALPTPHWDKTRSKPCQIITLPVVAVEVAYPETVPILLLFALGLEHLPNMLANYLLPVKVVAEFPNAYEMSNLMARKYDIDKITGYAEQNSQIWGNALNLGVKDKKILDMVHNAWKVTAAARDIILNPRR